MLEQRAAELAGKTAGVTEKMAYATASGTALAGLTWNECAAIVGIIATVLMTAVSIYCKFRYLRLAEKRAAHEGAKAEEADDGE